MSDERMNCCIERCKDCGELVNVADPQMMNVHRQNPFHKIKVRERLNKRLYELGLGVDLEKLIRETHDKPIDEPMCSCGERITALESRLQIAVEALEHIAKVSLPFTDKGHYSSTRTIAVECLSKAKETIAKCKDKK